MCVGHFHIPLRLLQVYLMTKRYIWMTIMPIVYTGWVLWIDFSKSWLYSL